MYSVGSPMVSSAEAKANISYEEVTRDTIQKRENLQDSVIKHTNRIVDQVQRSLREMETIIDQDLSPIHLRRIIDFIREDIQPVKTFIKRISTHAEQIGSLKKEHELRKTMFYHSLRASSSSSSTSDSDHSAASYLVRRNARRESPAKSDRLHINDLSSETYTVHDCCGDYQDYSRQSRKKHRARDCKARSRSKSVYLTPNCSPERLSVMLWTPPAYKKTRQSSSGRSRREDNKQSRSRRREDNERCRDCRMRMIDCRCQDVDEVDCVLDNLKETEECEMSNERLRGKAVKDMQCGDDCTLDFVDAPVQTCIDTDDCKAMKVVSTWPWRIMDWCKRLKYKLTGSSSVGTLEKLILLLVAYLGYQWWKGILYRLGVVYRVYTGGYDIRGAPSM